MSSNDKLPPHWHEKESTKRKGKIYYFNTVFKKVAWKIEKFDPCPKMCSMCTSYLKKCDGKVHRKRKKVKTTSDKEKKIESKSSDLTNNPNHETIKQDSSENGNIKVLNVISEDHAPSTSKAILPRKRKLHCKRSLDEHHSPIPKKIKKTNEIQLEEEFVCKKSAVSREESPLRNTLKKRRRTTQFNREKSSLVSISPKPEEAQASLPDIPMEVDDINTEITNIRSSRNFVYQQDIQSSQDLTFDSNNIFIVVDTNVFIADIELVKFISEVKVINCIFVVTIPYVVFQELDVLKQREKLKLSAQSAIVWCNKCLTGDGSQSVMCQSYSCYLQIQEKNSNKKADDIIRDYCLYMTHELDAKVCLLSEDVNLRNKALLSGLMTHSIKEMWKIMKSEDPCHMFQNKKTARNTSKIFHEHTSKNTEHSFSEDMSVDYAEESCNENRYNNNIPKVIKGMQHYIDDHPVEEENNCHVHRKEIVNDKASILKSLENVLGTILESAMKESYGDIWKQIVIVKPPWKLLQIFKCYKKHWIAVFIDKFDEKVQNQLEKVRYLIQSNASFEKLLLEISELFVFLGKSNLLPLNDSNEMQTSDYQNPAREISHELDPYITATTDKIELLVDEAANCISMGVSPANQADVQRSVSKLFDCVISLLRVMEGSSVIKIMKSLMNFWTNVGDSKTVDVYSSLCPTDLYLSNQKTVGLCSSRLQTCTSKLKELLGT